MSLIIAVYVPTGIVISGDSRTTGTLAHEQAQPTPTDPNAKISVQTQVVLSDSTHKVFLVHKQFGIATWGAAIINNLPVAHYVEQFEVGVASEAPGTTVEVETKLLSFFQNVSPGLNAGFVVAGYDGGTPWVGHVNPEKNTTVRLNIDAATGAVNYGIVRGGDTLVVNRLLSEPQFHPLWNLMSVQDAVDYSRHLIRSTIDQMRFEPRFPTVGGLIDTLVITPAGSHFLARKELRCM